jgi:hypothetical protein
MQTKWLRPAHRVGRAGPHRARRCWCLFMSVALCAGLGAPAVNAATPQPVVMRAHPIGPEARLHIDGRLDEAAWRDAPVLADFHTFLPQAGSTAPQAYRTEVRVLVSADALVFGIRAFDPRPEEIRAPLLRRDRVQRDQDFISVLIDPAGERRAAQFVRVNPRGVLADGMFIPDRSAQVEGNDGDEDFSPDFDVEVATQLDELGYTVELRLPRTALRQPYRAPPATARDASGSGLGGPPAWRVLVARSIPRASSLLVTSAPVPKDALSFLVGLHALEGVQALAMAGARPAAPQLRPTLTLRGQRRQERDEDRGASLDTRRSEAALGLELKWQPRADWVLDATLNPDFSTVEADTPQLAGNTRFALSTIEKRPFFLESSDLIDLPIAAFYTRSVTDPQAGARLSWRGEGADATALAMRDRGGGLTLLPGAFATAVRNQDGASDVALWRGRWHLGGAAREAAEEGASPNMSLGALLTTRQPQRGESNRVLGADALWRPHEGLRLRGRALTSQTDTAAGRRDGHLVFIGARQRSEDWASTLEWQRTSSGFRNDNGFVEQAGVQRLSGELIRRWGERSWGSLVAHEFETFVWAEERRALRDPGAGIEEQTVTRRWHPGIWLAADPNVEAYVHAVLDAERVRPGGVLHPVRGVAGQLGINPAPWFTRLELRGEWGRRVDVEADRTGRGHVVTIDAQWRASVPVLLTFAGATSPRPWGLELRQRWQQGAVQSPDGRRALTDTAWQWLTVLHLNERDSIRYTEARQLTRRAVDASLALTADDRRSASRSWIVQRQIRVGSSVAAGWIQGRGQERGLLRLSEQQDELFFKASFEW